MTLKIFTTLPNGILEDQVYNIAWFLLIYCAITLFVEDILIFKYKKENKLQNQITLRELNESMKSSVALLGVGLVCLQSAACLYYGMCLIAILTIMRIVIFTNCKCENKRKLFWTYVFLPHYAAILSEHQEKID